VPTRRLLIEWILIAFGASLFVLIAINSGALKTADNLIYDYFAPAYAPPADDRIVIVEIDNHSLAMIGGQNGRWPWPRSVHAQAIDALQAASPKAILYDVLFTEPSGQDAELGRAITGKPPVLLPLLFEAPGMNGSAFSITRPVDVIAHAAAALGTANIVMDADGRTRRIEIATPTQQAVIPHLTEFAYRSLIGSPSPAYLKAQRDFQPVQLAIRPSGSFRSVSFVSVLRGEVPAAFLKDKIVMVGASAPGLGDTHPVSMASRGQMPGIELQANLLSSLLADRFTATLPVPWIIAFSLIPIWILMVAFWRFSPTNNLRLSLGLLIAMMVASVFLLAVFGIWVPPSAALLGIIIVYPLWGWRRLASISRFLVNEVDGLRATNNLPTLPKPDWREGDRIAGEAVQLHSLIAMIRQAGQEREEVLQFLSHDMRAPQAAIIALTEGKGAKALDPEKVGLIRQQARQTLRLADTFVQLARLEAQPHPLEPFDMADILAQATDMVWPFAKARSITIERKTLSEEIWINGDAAALARALTNLLENAVRHSPSGSIVRASVQKEGSSGLCIITDQGPGLPEERRDNPFMRFGASTTPQGSAKSAYRGAGLGLAFVRTAITRHNGTIDYDQPESGGARFTIRLPMADNPDED
jgi:CHASE2 domain-containing sensor protein/two-component sensor histidine kinase